MTSWNDEPSKKDTAKQEASHVASQASQQASQVAGTAQEQGAKVATEAKQQARDLLAEARTQANEQAGAQKERAAGGLRAVAGELDSMASSSDSSGVATEVVRQVSQQVSRAADWLENKDAQGVLDDVRGLARRSPGMFLLGAAGAGLLAGRLTRATTQAVRSENESSSTSSYPTSSYPTSPATPVTTAPGVQTTSYSEPTTGGTYGTASGVETTDPTGASSTYGGPAGTTQGTTYGEEPLR
jgi:hypothetical protein